MRCTWRTLTMTLAIPAVLLGLMVPLQGAAGARGGWGPLEDVGVPGPAEAGPYDARVVVAEDGSALAVLRAQGGGDHHGRRLFAARRSADRGTWGPTKRVSGPIGWGSFDVAAGPHGSFSVVWQHRISKRITRIEERHLIGGSWSPVNRLGRGTRPAVAIDGAGGTLAVWGASALNSATRPAGGPWSEPRQLAHELVREPTVDVNAAGDAVVAWWTRRGENRPWHARAMVERRGTWGRPHTVVDSPYWESWRGSAAAEMGPAGRALVLFVRLKFARPGGYRNAVVWSRSRGDGTWSTTRFLTRGLLEDGGHVGLSMNASGQALAAWTCSDSDGSQVEAVRFRRDATWGDPRRIGSDGRFIWLGTPWLDDAGGAHVALWRGYSYLAFSQRPDHAWTGPVRIGHGEYGDASGRGTRMVATWFGGGVHARVLDVG